MIDKLRKINAKLLEKNLHNDEKEKYLIIERILKNDKCFFQMNIEMAFAILRDLEISEDDLPKVYEDLIDIKNYSEEL